MLILFLQHCCKNNIYLLKDKLMLNRIEFDRRWDSIGIGASMLCVVHCLLLPVVFSTLSVLGIELIENIYLEIATILLSLGIGILAFRSGYRSHRKIWPLIAFIGSILFLVLGNIWHGEEVTLKSIAVSGIISSHIVNWKLRKSAPAIS